MLFAATVWAQKASLPVSLNYGAPAQQLNAAPYIQTGTAAAVAAATCLTALQDEFRTTDTHATFVCTVAGSPGTWVEMASTGGSYANPAWITALAWAKLTGVPSFEPSISAGTASQYWRGDKSWQTLNAAAVTNAVDATGSYSNPSWITALAWAKITGAPSALPPNGSAAGGLGGTYPNPTVVQVSEAGTSVNNAASPYTVLAADSLIYCDATAGAVVLNLPATSGSHREITVKKIDSSASACTLTRAGSDVLDGATTVALTKQYAVGKVYDRVAGTWDRLHVSQQGGDLTGVTGSTTVTGLEGVPFCNGFTPTTGQAIQYTTAGSPNPCYTAAAGGTVRILFPGAAAKCMSGVPGSGIGLPASASQPGSVAPPTPACEADGLHAYLPFLLNAAQIATDEFGVPADWAGTLKVIADAWSPSTSAPTITVALLCIGTTAATSGGTYGTTQTISLTPNSSSNRTLVSTTLTTDAGHATKACAANDILQFKLSVTPSSATTTANTTSGSATMTVTSATGLAIGQYIYGTGVTTGTTVSNLVGTTVTLSQNATATGTGVSFTFVNSFNVKALRFTE